MPTRLGGDRADDKPEGPAIGGKLLVIAMLAVIFILVTLVAWLLMTRPEDAEMSTVPVQHIPQPVESPATPPVSPSPDGTGGI